MPFTFASSPLEVALGAVLERAGVTVDEGDRLPSLFTAGEAALNEIGRLETEKARLEGRLVDAYATLHTVLEQQHDVLGLSRGPVPVRADTVVTQEIACATGVGAAEVSRRLELATAPRRHRVLRGALRAGTVSLYRALHVVAETRLLPDEVLADLETTVLAPAPDGSVSSQRLFSSRLRRCVRSADDRSGDERRRSAEVSRKAHGRLTEDGIGTFTVTAPAETVVAVLDRADAVARAARAAGDPRTLDQLRSDAICSLALFGSLAAEHSSFGAPLPTATVRIVVPFEVAVGLSDAACELPGYGWVTAAHARRIITADGSVWQRLAVDVRTGRTLELSTDRYRPTAAMVEHVRAVDGVCRAPGCQVPADRCDLDHVVPWPADTTDVTNAQSLSRGCHHPKTAGLWSAARAPDHGIRWTTLTGREYVTYPRDWREALTDPGASPPSPEGSPPDDPPPF
ncbi:HNH endonuclease signature motif containing protein [Terrabacter terrigena]|uniref:HNH endonuclease signature motif containing protein n=1 Tax=Terrabacter terrigena TaxID=574718 RepID=A0ABW3N1R2_9MICO